MSSLRAPIRTDGARMFARLADRGYLHEPTPGNTAADLDAVMPGPHLVSSLLKRWTVGTLHYRVSRQHLPYYLDEFTFRFNRRTSRARGMLFYRLLQQAVDTDPHPLKELIGG
jgi:ISXO2-like transposase domain